MSEIHCSSLVRRWQGKAGSGEPTIVLSPALTSRTAETVLKLAEDVEVYTRFEAESFASGRSSLLTVKRLIEAGVALYHLPGLNARVFLSGDDFATVGSQELTSGSRGRREATVLLTEPDQIGDLSAGIEPWLQEAIPISLALVVDMERVLPAARSLHLKFVRAAEKADQDVWRLQRARSAARAGYADLRKRFTGAGSRSVSKSDAVDAVWASAWWYSHPAGPVHAPGHAHRVKGGPDWRVDFGANSFMVARAISRCRRVIARYLEGLEEGDAPSPRRLRLGLARQVEGSVVNHRGDEYHSYPVQGQDMVFGSQSIDVADFIDAFLRMSDAYHLAPRR